MDNDGKNPVNLTKNQAWDSFPVVSPDGSKILFISDRDGDKDIYMMELDGSGLRNMTNDSYESYYFVTWSPDGSRIAYAADTDENRINETIYIMDVESGNYQKLTEGWSSPQWNPIELQN